MTRLSRPQRDEEGSALVLALVFLTVLGVFIGAVLSFGSTSLRVSVAVREQRDHVYAADGAVDGAVNAIRGDAALGREGGACPDFVAPFQEADASRTVSVRVACEGLPGSGTGGGAPATPANTPAQAVLALTTNPAEDGIVQASNNDLRIRGNVVSNTTVNVPVAGASLTVEGVVTARGGCTGNGTVTPSCTPMPLAALDPGYARRSDAPATPGPLRDLQDQRAACAGAQSMVRFRPGLYTDAAALSSLTSGTGACPDSLFWFEPGVYYFDFANAGSHEWRIGGRDTRVVGGQPKGWAPAAPRPAVTLPGGCRTADDGATDGVQLVFGGDSSVFVQDAQVELCAKPTATEQQIALYGMPSGATPAPATATSSPSARPAGSTPGFANPEHAYAVDETPLRRTSDFAVANAGANTTGSVTLGGFGTSAVPAGSRITGVKVRVAHEETGSVNALQLTVQSATGAATFTSHASCGATRLCIGAYRAQEFDVSSLFPTLDAVAGATAKYDATVRKNDSATAKLDGVALVVTYVPPAYRALTAPTVLTTRGAPALLSVAGTVYAPTAAVDVQLTNIATQVIRRGVIARAVRVEVTGSSTFAGNAIELPPPGGPSDREVLFTAQIAGATRLRAVVSFEDAGGAVPGRAVEVDEWSVQR